ncbi:CbtA family protein [Streptomyces manipurensis]|uniref:CbtA family protein n=1 Tax=Streptomyces manipurensis TaxID=1077945 RepID=UPI003C6ED502
MTGTRVPSGAAAPTTAAPAAVGNGSASAAAGAAFVAALTVASALLPGIDEVPAGFPASLLWEFRLASLAVQTVLWATFGLVFGFLAERALVPHPAPKEAVQPTS